MNALPSASRRPLRVLQLGSPTGLYGAERWILALVRHLDPARVQSVVATIRDEPHLQAALCQEAAASGFPVAVLECPGRFNPAAVRELRRLLRSLEIDVLHTHGYKTDLIGRLATWGTRCRIVATPHGWSRDAGPALRLYECLDRLAFPFFDAVAPLSADLLKGLRRLPAMRGRLRLIVNAVDLSEAEHPALPPPEIQAWRGRGERLVGYIGQLIPRKGLTTLLQAFAMLPAASTRLVLVGEGEQRTQLEQQACALGIADRVSLTGFRTDRIGLLQGFDLFVLPSMLEGIPRCLMEAMAARVPVVASDIPGCRDLVQDGSTGLLFPPQDASALAAAMGRVLDDSVLANQLGAAARDLMHQRYAATRMAAEYADLFEQVVA